MRTDSLIIFLNKLKCSSVSLLPVLYDSEGLRDITEVISVSVQQLYRLSSNVEMTFIGLLSSCAVLFTSRLFF